MPSNTDAVVIFDEVDAYDMPVVEDDAMDAPSDWDMGAVTFDPYVG